MFSDLLTADDIKLMTSLIAFRVEDSHSLQNLVGIEQLNPGPNQSVKILRPLNIILSLLKTLTMTKRSSKLICKGYQFTVIPPQLLSASSLLMNASIVTTTDDTFAIMKQQFSIHGRWILGTSMVEELSRMSAHGHWSMFMSLESVVNTASLTLKTFINERLRFEMPADSVTKCALILDHMCNKPIKFSAIMASIINVCPSWMLTDESALCHTVHDFQHLTTSNWKVLLPSIRVNEVSQFLTTVHRLLISEYSQNKFKVNSVRIMMEGLLNMINQGESSVNTSLIIAFAGNCSLTSTDQFKKYCDWCMLEFVYNDVVLSQPSSFPNQLIAIQAKDQLISDLMGLKMYIDDWCKYHDSCDMVCQMISSCSSKSLKSLFDALLLLRGQMFEDFVKLCCFEDPTEHRSDRTVLDAVSFNVHPYVKKLLNAPISYPSHDIVTSKVTEGKLMIRITELVWASNYEPQVERMEAKLNVLKTRLLQYAPDCVILTQVVGVRSNADDWYHAAEQVIEFHDTGKRATPNMEDNLGIVLSTLTNATTTCFKWMSYSDRRRIEQSVQYSHSGLSGSPPVPDIHIDEVELADKINFMKRRQMQMMDLNVHPIHCDELGPNDLNLEDCITGKGHFALECEHELSPLDKSFLKQHSEQLGLFVNKGIIDRCDGSGFLVAPASSNYSASCCQSGNSFVIIAKCTKCNVLPYNFIKFNASKNVTVVESDQLTRLQWSSGLAINSLQFPVVLAKQMIDVSTSNVFTEDSCHKWIDPLFRYPSPYFQIKPMMLTVDLIKLSNNDQLRGMEEMRRAVRSSKKVTTISNLIRNCQASKSFELGVPMTILDGSHGKWLFNTDELLNFSVAIKSEPSGQLTKLVQEAISRKSMTAKKLTGQHSSKIVDLICSELKTKKSVVTPILLGRSESGKYSDAAVVVKSIMDKKDLWLVASDFTTTTHNLSLMSAKGKFNELCNRAVSKKEKLASAGKSFPYMKARVDQIGELMSVFNESLNEQHHQNSNILIGRVKEFVSGKWIHDSLVNFCLRESIELPSLQLSDEVVDRLCRIKGFIHSVQIASLATCIDELVNTRLGPANIGWKTCPVSGVQIWVHLPPKSTSSDPVYQCVLYHESSVIASSFQCGPESSAINAPGWSSIPGSRISKSHCFKMNGRSIRQCMSGPAYLLDNVITEIQLNKLVTVNNSSQLSVDWESNEVRDLIECNMTLWYPIILNNRRSLTTFCQGLRYLFVNLAGEVSFHTTLASKVSMECFNSFDHHILRHVTNNVVKKFNEAWYQSLQALSAGSARFLDMIQTGAVSDEGIRQEQEDESSNSLWVSPRLIGSGSNKSVGAAIRELFKAYQFERSIDDYDNGCILVGNKVAKGGWELEQKFLATKFCDGIPWNLWSARGYTHTDHDRYHKIPDGVVASNRREYLDASLCTMIAINQLKLPAVCRRYVNCGAKLMINAHPQGQGVTKDWKTIIDLSLGPSSRSNSSSGVINPLLVVNIPQLKDKSMKLRATHAQKVLQTSDFAKLESLMKLAGYCSPQMTDFCKQLADEVSKEKQQLKSRDLLTTILGLMTECKYEESAVFFSDTVSAEIIIMIKHTSMHDKLALISKSRSIWLVMMTRLSQCFQQLEMETMLDAARQTYDNLVDNNSPPSESLKGFQLVVQSSISSLPVSFLDCMRLVGWIITAIDLLPSKLIKLTGLPINDLSDADIIRHMLNEPTVTTDAWRESGLIESLSSTCQELTLFWLSCPDSPDHTFSCMTGQHVHNAEWDRSQAFDDKTILINFLHATGYASSLKATSFSDDSIWSQMCCRPLKKLLSTFAKSCGNKTFRLPRSGRVKNVVSISERLISQVAVGSKVESSQLSRSVKSAFALQVYFFGRAVKAQVGSTRELPIKDLITNEATVLSELTDRAICEYFREEAVTHPKGKKELQNSMSVTTQQSWKSVSSQLTNRTFTTEPLMKTYDSSFPSLGASEPPKQVRLNYSSRQTTSGVNGLLDHAAWGPGHIPSSFSAASNAFQFAFGRDLQIVKRLIFEGMSQKDDEIPAVMWQRWLAPDFDATLLPSYMVSQYNLVMKRGVVAVPRPGDMGQGMLHMGSSLFGISVGYARRHVSTILATQYGISWSCIDQQGSDDRNSSMLTTLMNNPHVNADFGLTILGLHDQTMNQLIGSRRKTFHDQPVHMIQRCAEFLMIALDVMLGKPGNHKMSDKAGWLRCLSEMNSRFIAGNRVITPSVRDTAPLCQGPTLSTPSETFTELFSRTKAAYSCGASECTIMPLYIYQLSRLSDRFELAPGMRNAVIHKIITASCQLSDEEYGLFDMPLSLGGCVLPTISNCLFSSTQDAELSKIQRLKLYQTPANMITCIFLEGLTRQSTSAVGNVLNPELDNLLTISHLGFPAFRIRKRLMQKGGKVQAVLDNLMSNLTRAVESDDLNESLTTFPVQQVCDLMAPYLPARTLKADCLKMHKVLQSPGLMRSLADADWSHLSFLSTMVAKGHALTVPFEWNVELESSIKTTINWDHIKTLLSWDESLIELTKNLTDEWIRREETSINNDTSITCRPTVLPGSIVVNKDTQHGIKYNHALYICWLRGLAGIQIYNAPCNVYLANDINANPLFSQIPFWTSTAKSDSIRQTATDFRQSVSRNCKQIENMQNSDCIINDAHDSTLLTNPPLSAVMYDCAQEAFINAQGRLRDVKRLAQDLIILKEKCPNELKQIRDCVELCSTAGCTPEVQREFASCVVALWSRCIPLTKYQVSTIIPSTTNCSNEIKVKRLMCRSIITNLEFDVGLPDNFSMFRPKVFTLASHYNTVNHLHSQIQEVISACFTIKDTITECIELVRLLNRTYRMVVNSISQSMSDHLRTIVISDDMTPEQQTSLTMKSQALLWILTGAFNDSVVKDMSTSAVVTHSYINSVTNPTLPGMPIGLEFSATLSSADTLMMAQTSGSEVCYVIINPDEMRLTTLLQNLSLKLTGHAGSGAAPNCIINSSLFTGVINPDQSQWHLTVENMVKYGRAPPSSPILNVKSSWRTSGEPAWSKACRTPSIVQFEVTTNPLQINLKSTFDESSPGMRQASSTTSSSMLDEDSIQIIRQMTGVNRSADQVALINSIIDQYQLSLNKTVITKSVVRLDNNVKLEPITNVISHCRAHHLTITESELFWVHHVAVAGLLSRSWTDSNLDLAVQRAVMKRCVAAMSADPGGAAVIHNNLSKRTPDCFNLTLHTYDDAQTTSPWITLVRSGSGLLNYTGMPEPVELLPIDYTFNQASLFKMVVNSRQDAKLRKSIDELNKADNELMAVGIVGNPRAAYNLNMTDVEQWQQELPSPFLVAESAEVQSEYHYHLNAARRLALMLDSTTPEVSSLQRVINLSKSVIHNQFLADEDFITWKSTSAINLTSFVLAITDKELRGVPLTVRLLALTKVCMCYCNLIQSEPSELHSPPPHSTDITDTELHMICSFIIDTVPFCLSILCDPVQNQQVEWSVNRHLITSDGYGLNLDDSSFHQYMMITDNESNTPIITLSKSFDFRITRSMNATTKLFQDQFNNAKTQFMLLLTSSS